MMLTIEGHSSNHNQTTETTHVTLDAGVHYLDMTWSYCLPNASEVGEPEDTGHGEYLVCGALHSWHGSGKQVFMVTKASRLHALNDDDNYGWQAGARSETVIVNTRESASRLSVDTLDLLYLYCNNLQVPYKD